MFIDSSCFAKNSREDDLFEQLAMNEISFYCFCFDEPKEEKMRGMRNSVDIIPDSHIILVKNYEVIERAFHNISFPRDNNKAISILSIKFSNHNFIH